MADPAAQPSPATQSGGNVRAILYRVRFAGERGGPERDKDKRWRLQRDRQRSAARHLLTHLLSSPSVHPLCQPKLGSYRRRNNYGFRLSVGQRRSPDDAEQHGQGSLANARHRARRSSWLPARCASDVSLRVFVQAGSSRGSDRCRFGRALHRTRIAGTDGGRQAADPLDRSPEVGGAGRTLGRPPPPPLMKALIRSIGSGKMMILL